MTDAVTEYRARYDGHLQDAARRLEALIRDHLADAIHVDRITARAKDPDSFRVKAARESDSGLKYPHPLTEIQDQLGARVVVYYLADVESVVALVRRYFQPIELADLVPESEWEFGYFGKHLVLALPRDVMPEGVEPGSMPPFFELQVKTLFQHAWSEGNHDLGYKPTTPLTSEHQRCLAYAAAQAWGADRMFEELRSELSA